MELPIVRAVLTVWLTLFLLSRAMLFVRGSIRAQDMIEESKSVAQTCLAHPRMRVAEPKMCEKHLTRRNELWYWLAVEYLTENTYLCGYDTCDTVFKTVVGQVGIVATLATFGVLLAVMSVVAIGWCWMNRLPAPGERTYQTIETGAHSARTKSFPLIEEYDDETERDARVRRRAVSSADLV